MKKYFVTYEVEVEAENVEEAGDLADAKAIEIRMKTLTVPRIKAIKTEDGILRVP